MPSALARKPYISSWLSPFFDAFLKLNRKRQAGYASMQPLTPEGIILFGNSHGFRNDMDFFYDIVDELDQVFLEYQESKRPKGKAGTTGKPPKRRK